MQKTILQAILLLTIINLSTQKKNCKLYFGIDSISYGTKASLKPVKASPSGLSRWFNNVSRIYLCETSTLEDPLFKFDRSSFNCQPGRFAKKSPIGRGKKCAEGELCYYSFGKKSKFKNSLELEDEDCSQKKQYTHYFWPEQYNFVDGRYVKSPVQSIFLFKTAQPEIELEEVSEIRPVEFSTFEQKLRYFGLDEEKEFLEFKEWYENNREVSEGGDSSHGTVVERLKSQDSLREDENDERIASKVDNDEIDDQDSGKNSELDDSRPSDEENDEEEGDLYNNEDDYDNEDDNGKIREPSDKMTI